MFTHLSLRLRIFLFFALIAIGGSVLLIVGLVYGYMRLGEQHALSSFVIAGLVGVLAVIGLSAWIWTLFDDHIARPVERLAADLRARAHADVEGAIDQGAARYLGDLGPAASAVATYLTETKNAMALAVGRETARLSLEKSRLEALLAEMPDGVLFCTADHKIALYNGQARDILGNRVTFGLNRHVSGLLHPEPIEMAYRRLLASNDRHGADILVATIKGARLLEARIRLMWLDGQETAQPGYVLNLRDVSTGLSVQAERAHLLNELLDGVSDMAAGLPQDDAVAQRLTELAARISDRKAPTDTQWWPLEALAANDLGIALAARLERKGLTLQADLPSTRIRCDGFAMTRLLERLVLGWSGKGATDFALGIASSDTQNLTLTLTAKGSCPDQASLQTWLDQPLSPGMSGFSGRDVLITHATSAIPQDMKPDHARISIALALAQVTPIAAPPLVQYDFDLLQAEIPEALSATPLRQLPFVVFDTETTGLNPQVDEICQIAAIRIVNGRIVDSERFDMLVNPGRSIPAASTRVHHITNDMVQDAPPVSDALARFHRFADGAVLVAHNAPFDMSFLRRRETEIKARFDQPILDTVLCSAILFGQSADHTLDALCNRLGIVIPEQDRHTALGDTIGTAEAFRKMIPMLEAAELPRLGALIKAFDRHARLLEHLN